ncbi:MAG: putative flap endonuclease-1-like 5' DNA nuclease [Polaribacter sp.]|jgi:predicted flap endonuclease-1-like 5' DNA nuclease
MLKPHYLINFCLECTLEVLPVLTLAWLLGCLFWYTYNSVRTNKTKTKLKGQVKNWKQQAKSLEEELSTVHFDWESVNTELKSLRNNHKELEIRYKALETFKGTSANMIYEPVPPPNSLIKEMEAADQAEKGLIYFSVKKSTAEAFDKELPNKRKPQKIIKAKKRSQRENNYNNVFVPSNLSIIEGLGSKLEKLLKENDISTWTRLAVTSAADLKAILAKAGPKYIVHDPSNWPQQAALARVGQWDDLILLQRGLSAANKSKIKKRYKKIRGAEAYRLDDLKIIEGIGPKIEQLLKDGGIDNWSKLASATEADIMQILNAAGDRYRLADPGAWAKQARLANEGQMEVLREYQEGLKGGKER